MSLNGWIGLAGASLALLAAVPGRAASLSAQEPAYLDLTINNTGLAIGDAPRVNGIRLNFRDRHLDEVNGLNVTIWSPYRPVRGKVNGIAVGLPVTGAASIDGIGVGALGVQAHERFRGIVVGGLGAGAGGSVSGLMVGGLGVGSGGSVNGIAIGGLGVGSGGDVRGAMIGGLGAGAGGLAEGLLVGGLGVGAGGMVRGLSIGGVGVGSGGDVAGVTIGGVGVGSGGRLRGLTIAGVGAGAGDGVSGLTIAGAAVGSGGDVTGLSIAGAGIGSGGTLRWVSIAGLGVGAPRIRGVAIAAAVGGRDVNALAIAPAYFRIVELGAQRGVAIAAVTHIQGTQHGLTIGVVNYTRKLEGVQVGLINIARENPSGRRVLPIVNWN